jgi:hypothetical protein
MRGSAAASARDHLPRAVLAVVVDEDDLVQVVPVEVDAAGDERPDVHLLVVAGDDHRDRAAQRLVVAERDARPHRLAGRLLRVQQDRAGKRTHPGRILQRHGEVAQRPRDVARQRPIDEVVEDGEDADEAHLRDQLVELRAG